MRLAKPPQFLSEEELAGFVRSLINDQWPKSDALDYKAVLNQSQPKDRTELAKDISSFANETGGTLVYGVPEGESQGEAAVPALLNKRALELGSGIEKTDEKELIE